MTTMKSNQPHHVFGKPHPNHQVYECDYQSYEDLWNHLPPAVNPIHQWWDTRLHASAMIQNQNKQGRSSGSCYEIPTPGNVSSWFRNDEQVAFYGSPNSTKSPLTYAKLQKEIQSFSGYHTANANNGVFVVALLLPPALMAETAVVLMTLLAQHQDSGICVAPLDPNMPSTKIQQALAQLNCTAVVTSRDLYYQCQDVLQDLADIRLVEPTKSTVGIVEWTILRQEALQPAHFGSAEGGSGADRPALLLRTSGTTNTPKLVPLTSLGLLYNATCLATSLQLDPKTDVGCNVMPLFHIGGIACGLLTVLVSGSSVVMLPGPFESHAFLDALECAGNNGGCYQQPTWYYGVPSMHKALILTAKAQHAGAPNGVLKKKNNLRFVRSGAAHLPHETAVELAHVLQTNVMPTYSMSECMPVCSGHHVTIATNRHGQEVLRTNVPQDTVGVAIGSSLAILDEEGQPLPYGEIGQVSLKGPGVIDAYVGLSRHESHTSNGWFQTGDMGVMDANGNVVLSGRSKELIKRGGDQVWPNEVDSTVETVKGVRLAVTFGVPNELWGEEVHVAVVLDADQTEDQHDALQAHIVRACTERLGAASAPSKIHFLESPAALLKGPTGKYLRTKMAHHLGAQPVDTGALTALKAMATFSTGAAPATGSDTSASSDEMTKAKPPPSPSSALNGVRFLTACFVVHYHIGLFPNAPWLRIQSFTLDMTIFFLLGAFQLTTSIKSEVQSNSVQFVGTKIGSMHALFLVSQILAFASYLLFQCGDGGYQQVMEDRSCATTIPYVTFLINTLTGLVVSFKPPVNAPAWFQSAFYMFLVLFPTLDKHLRSYSNRKKTVVFGISLVLASLGYAAVYWAGGMMFTFTLPSWLPALVAGMIAGYWFQDFAVLDDDTEERPRNLFQRPRAWGVLTDCISLVFLLIVVLVALDGGCVDMTLDNYNLARPNQPYEAFEYHGEEYVEVCDLTYDEFVDHVHDHPDEANHGRWTTELGGWIGFCRLGTPLVLLWLWGLAHGRGMTARIFQSTVLQRLAPYAYPLYLLHVPVARFYWVMTRGHEAEAWWDMAPIFPFPVEWYEFFVLIGICLVLAKVLDRWVVPHLSRYTIAWGVQVCRFLSKYGLCCLLKESPELANDDDDEETTITMREVSRLVRGLTGEPQVDRSTRLQELGLDSLGATALLGTLRASVESAKSLTLSELSSCETVGDLVDLLEARDKPPRQLEKPETFVSGEV